MKAVVIGKGWGDRVLLMGRKRRGMQYCCKIGLVRVSKRAAISAHRQNAVDIVLPMPRKRRGTKKTISKRAAISSDRRSAVYIVLPMPRKRRGTKEKTLGKKKPTQAQRNKKTCVEEGCNKR